MKKIGAFLYIVLFLNFCFGLIAYNSIVGDFFCSLNIFIAFNLGVLCFMIFMFLLQLFLLCGAYLFGCLEDLGIMEE